MNLTHTPGNISIDLTPEEERVLYSDMVSVTEFFEGLVDQILRQKKRQLAEAERHRLMADPTVTAIPKDDDELAKAHIERPDYEDAKARQARFEAEVRAAQDAQPAAAP